MISCTSSAVQPGATSASTRPSGSTLITATSVTIRLTHSGAVSGNSHSPHDLGIAITIRVLHRNDNSLGPDSEVHGSADVADATLGQHPVSQIAALGDLHGAQNRDVYMSTPDHPESLDGVEERHARVGRQELPSGVDEVYVLVTGFRHRPVAQHAALAVVHHAATLWDELRTESWYPYPKVDYVAVLQLARDAHCHDLSVECLFLHNSVPQGASQMFVIRF